MLALGKLSVLLCSIYTTILLQDNHFAIANPSKIDPEVSKLLSEGHKVNVIVSFVAGVKSALDKASSLRHASRKDQNQAIVDALEENAKSSQGTVLEKLASSSRSAGSGFAYYKQYWNSNVLFIKAASSEVINEIASDPNVLNIKNEPSYGIIPTPTMENNYKLEDKEKAIQNAENVTEEIKNWGVTRMQAPEAWKEIGSRGEGVLVATIDTGVRYTHELLRDNFVGIEYGWYDAVHKSPTPIDYHGHGTGTMSNLAGKSVGIAPGTKWMTCAGCNGTSCPAESLLDCIQWLACPTLPDGSNPDCSKAPQIISNSWVSAQTEDGYNDGIMNWRSLGIIPVFGIGNTGLGCNRTHRPANLPFVIGVGGTNELDHHFFLSSVGPAPDGITIKPDVVGPAVFVQVATHSTDNSTDIEWGTSFATPHVAGVAALLKARQPELTYEETYKLITENTDRNIILLKGYKDTYCNTSLEDVFPNMTIFPNIYVGHGQPNALKAVLAQTTLLNKKM